MSDFEENISSRVSAESLFALPPNRPDVSRIAPRKEFKKEKFTTNRPAQQDGRPGNLQEQGVPEIPAYGRV